MDDILQDERFAHVKTDPRFRRMPKKTQKIVISQRFKKMFEDKDFSTNYTVDKRGAPMKTSSDKHLQKLYHLDDLEINNTKETSKDLLMSAKETGHAAGEVSSAKAVQSKAKPSKAKQSKLKFKQAMLERKKKKLAMLAAGDGKDGASSSDEDNLEDQSMDLARGRILLSSSSEDSQSESESQRDSSSEDESASDADATSGEEKSEEEESQESSAEDTGCTARLAVLNLDWDRIRAADIFFTLNSFKPAGGFIRSVKIYPSEFGLKRLAEEKFGPPELRRDMLRGLSELRARAMVRQLDKAADPKPSSHTDQRNRKLLRLAQKAAAAVMAEDVSRGCLDAVSTEQRVYDKLQQLVADSGAFSQEETQLMGALETAAPPVLHQPEESKSEKDRNKQKKKWEDEEKEDEKTKEKHRERLRKYQLQRLKYFYAVVECDSTQTAEHIYSQCHGREFESSAIKFDFQVIDDGEEFDQEPKDECCEIPSTYRPNFFINAALSQVKVESTWDETDRERSKVLTKKLKKKEEPNEDDLQQYIASNSDEDYEDDAREERSEPEEKMERELTWSTGLKKATADLVKKAGKEKNLTLWQLHQEKVKERRKKRKQEKKQLQAGEAAFSDDEVPDGIDMDDPYFAEEMQKERRSKKKGKHRHGEQEEASEEETEEQRQHKASLELLTLEGEEDRRHFSLRGLEEAAEAEKKTKRKRGKRHLRKPVAEEKDDFELDVQDARWQALFSDADFNLDPTNPDYKKTKGSKTIIQEKLKRRKKENGAAGEHFGKKSRLA